MKCLGVRRSACCVDLMGICIRWSLRLAFDTAFRGQRVTHRVSLHLGSSEFESHGAWQHRCLKAEHNATDFEKN